MRSFNTCFPVSSLFQLEWVLKNWCFCTVVLESPLDCRENKPVNPKGNKPWIFIGRTDAEAEAPILWLPDTKSQLIGKDPDAGKDWGQEEEGKTEDEMVGWYHWLSGHELEDTLRDGEGQGGLARWSPWGRKESDTTWQLNNSSSGHSQSRTGLPFSMLPSNHFCLWDECVGT